MSCGVSHQTPFPPSPRRDTPASPSSWPSFRIVQYPHMTLRLPFCYKCKRITREETGPTSWHADGFTYHPFAQAVFTVATGRRTSIQRTRGPYIAHVADTLLCVERCESVPVLKKTGKVRPIAADWSEPTRVTARTLCLSHGRCWPCGALKVGG